MDGKKESQWKRYGYLFVPLGIITLALGTLTYLSSQRQDLRSRAQTGIVVDVTFDGTSYTPQSVTVVEGTTIRWTNTHATDYTQIASNPHPTHTDYLPLNVGLIDPNGGTKSLVFPTAGTYEYHDHLNVSVIGTIIVIVASTSTPTPTNIPTATLAPTNTPTPTTSSGPTATKTPTPTVTFWA